MKTKDFCLDVKATDEDSGTFEGYASVFDVKDSYNEVVLPGAFADSLKTHFRQGTMPALLWQHDPSQPIGVWDDLAEDGKGLRGKGRLLKGVRLADEVHIMLKA
jgi:HK97 family phage prohead protease